MIRYFWEWACRGRLVVKFTVPVVPASATPLRRLAVRLEACRRLAHLRQPVQHAARRRPHERDHVRELLQRLDLARRSAEQKADTKARQVVRRNPARRLADQKSNRASMSNKRRYDPSYRFLENLKKRMKRATLRRNAKATDTLFELHASSGAMATANSRRLRTLDPSANGDSEAVAAYESARADASEDLRTLAQVTIEDSAKCVLAFNEGAKKAEQMHVCGACGVRDLEETYTLRALASVPDDHWLRLNEQALAAEIVEQSLPS